MDSKRYKWKDIKPGETKWLIDTNEYDQVIAIMEKGVEPNGVEWWGVYGPFKKKAHSQHLTEKDATAYAQAYLAQGEKEERIAWES